MSKVFRPFLILLLVLLPLRGWAQVSMAAGDCVVSTAPQSMQAHPHGAGDMAAMDMAAMDSCHTASAVDCGSHDHQHCVVCHIAVGQPAAFSLLLTGSTQHACPPAANTAWHSADPRALQRPPRA